MDICRTLPNLHIERWRGWWRLLNRWLMGFVIVKLLNTFDKGTFVSMTPVDSGRLRVFEVKKVKKAPAVYSCCSPVCRKFWYIYSEETALDHVFTWRVEGHPRTHYITLSPMEENTRQHHVRFSPLEGLPRWHYVTFSPLRGHHRGRFIKLFPLKGWKGILGRTISHFLRWNCSLEGTILHFLHWKGGRAPSMALNHSFSSEEIVIKCHRGCPSFWTRGHQEGPMPCTALSQSPPAMFCVDKMYFVLLMGPQDNFHQCLLHPKQGYQAKPSCYLTITTCFFWGGFLGLKPNQSIRMWQERRLSLNKWNVFNMKQLKALMYPLLCSNAPS